MIDWGIVESFPFPAPFEEQQYIGDEGEIHVTSWNGRKETTLVGPYSVRDCIWSILEYKRKVEFFNKKNSRLLHRKYIHS